MTRLKTRRRYNLGLRVGRVAADNANRAMAMRYALANAELARELIYDRARLPLPSTFAFESASVPAAVMGLYGDRRLYHPEGSDRPVDAYIRSARRLQVARKVRGIARAVPMGISFWRPSKVLICVRRRMRREVMHALGIAGSGGLKYPRYTWHSEISCEG